MNARELMIGDWVKIIDPKDPIKQISCIDEYLRIVDFWDDERLIVTSINNVLPIPLTEEILLKNGFEEDDYYSRYTLYFDNRRVRSSSIEVVPQDEDWSEVEMTIRSGMADISSIVEYVHELQHALRICGIEKEITV